MNKDQATTIIILLGAILFVLLADRSAWVFENLFWIVIGLTIAVGVVLAIRKNFIDWLAESRARKREKVEEEIKQIHQEISTYLGPRMTTESIPQRFPSKEAAQAFGDRWSLGGPDSFSVEAVDVHGRHEGLPGFDKTSISGGMLFSYPALFFGMSEANRDSNSWFFDFLRAKKRWLENYRDHLRKGFAP